MQLIRQSLTALSLCLLLTGCGLGLGGGEAPPAHPVVESFTINGEPDGLIVSEPQTLRLSAEIRSSAELEEVSFYANDRLLRSFTSGAYVYEWPVTASDNGFYDLRVEAVDALDNRVVAHFFDFLAIDID